MNEDQRGNIANFNNDLQQYTSKSESAFSKSFGKVENTQILISKQTNKGSFYLSDTLSEMLDISSDTKSKSFTSTIQIYAGGECLKKTITHYTWWTTAITICYLRLHASFHKTIWEVRYGKARKYLGSKMKN
ncbi:8101_t:CDS:2 [Entrophospora sp. SA101]|nr:21166_t:CDS:2 [Entrophospora sp. SA101]CAJ0841176.1 8101_t:CDS:2 [Entrophospora sp. SA101]CAJ0847443.1 5876_t:CDS:2 [Entrophospora sp. SA101]